ncbi:hypothetical protein [Pseudonocardia sp. WMMC193]|uniref:hypothetical protein n=1 Tax=Pseudonocardia sp. WMMC193 TaxID=2911965 RepID=UPI001F4229D9|nr:hypothetical protein [Pseudonocardia sp. WMMC193]MCF7548910.1 hypothetical protein [Pseudonocardia sp. WMMC193]
MASHTIAAGDVGVWEVALSANVADTVTFETGPDHCWVAWHPGATQPLYLVSGSANATVKGGHCQMLLPGTSGEIETWGTARVSLISAGAGTYSVSRS